jgi:hypothetical protein
MVLDAAPAVRGDAERDRHEFLADVVKGKTGKSST